MDKKSENQYSMEKEYLYMFAYSETCKIPFFTKLTVASTCSLTLPFGELFLKTLKQK